jgi:hypothetical protein
MRASQELMCFASFKLSLQLSSVRNTHTHSHSLTYECMFISTVPALLPASTYSPIHPSIHPSIHPLTQSSHHLSNKHLSVLSVCLTVKSWGYSRDDTFLTLAWCNGDFIQVNKQLEHRVINPRHQRKVS